MSDSNIMTQKVPNLGDYSSEPGEDKMPLVTIYFV